MIFRTDHFFKHIIRNITRHVVDCSRRGVGKNDRRASDLERVSHRGSRDVAEVDQHAESVHLPDHRATEIAETVAVDRLVSVLGFRSIGPEYNIWKCSCTL